MATVSLPDDAGLCEVLGLLPDDVPIILAVPSLFIAEVGLMDVPGLYPVVGRIGAAAI